MRRPRLKVAGEGFYHVVSRIGGRRFLMDDGEKQVLLGMIRAAAEFSGVEVHTHALMDNHFHLLIRVPQREEVDDGELAHRVRALYGAERSERLFAQWAKWEAKGQSSRMEEAKKRLRARMYDLSQFCKTFKETYSQDYNRRHDNTGTIWEGRFKSILLEGSWRVLMTVAAYIHLNPVRAGVVVEAEAATNTGYGAACAGDPMAQQGLVSLVRRFMDAGTTGWESVREIFQEAMDGALAKDAVLAFSEASPSASPGTAPVDDASTSGGSAGHPSLHELLRGRCIGFLHGGVLGSRGFLASQAALLPPRRRQCPESVLDHYSSLGLAVALGIRDAS